MFRAFFPIFVIFASLTANATKLLIEKELHPSVYQHISEKLESCQVIEYPFPHIVIDGIFPDDLYQMIAAHWPEDNAFVAAGGPNHCILPVTEQASEKSLLNQDQKLFWRIFGEVIVNRYIKPRIAMKLIPYLQLKAGLESYDVKKFDLTQDIAHLRQDNLAIDKTGYTITAHVDQRNMIAAMLLYLPLDNEHQHLGTHFYEGPSLEANTLYGRGVSGLKFAKMVPYKPNTLVVFMQTPASWHSYLPIYRSEDAGYKRRIYHAPLFFSPEFMYMNLPDYNRSYVDDYFFDTRFLNPKNWLNIWGQNE